MTGESQQESGKRRRDRRLLLAAAALIVVALLAVALLPVVWYRYTWDESLAFFKYRGGETVFADGYSEAAWRNLTAGMTGEAVIAALGQPLNKRPDRAGRSIWWFALPVGRDGSIVGHSRRVVLAPDGTVDHTEARFVSVAR